MNKSAAIKVIIEYVISSDTMIKRLSSVVFILFYLCTASLSEAQILSRKILFSDVKKSLVDIDVDTTKSKHWNASYYSESSCLSSPIYKDVTQAGISGDVSFDVYKDTVLRFLWEKPRHWGMNDYDTISSMLKHISEFTNKKFVETESVDYETTEYIWQYKVDNYYYLIVNRFYIRFMSDHPTFHKMGMK